MKAAAVYEATIAHDKATREAMKARGAEVPIPTDVVVAKTFAADAPAAIKKASEVEADDLDGVRLALEVGADRILLDNMDEATTR